MSGNTEGQGGEVKPQEPTPQGLPRGEEFTPLRNGFEINQAIKPTKDIAKILAYGIFGTKKKASFLYRSIYKYMLWYEQEEKTAFSPGIMDKRQGGKLRIRSWGEWKEAIRKMKCILNNDQINMVATLYQLQVRFFICGRNKNCTFLCTGQTAYMHHRVVNIIQLEGELWTILQGTTLPVLKFDWVLGKYDFDYYTAACGLEKVVRGECKSSSKESRTEEGLRDKRDNDIDGWSEVSGGLEKEEYSGTGNIDTGGSINRCRQVGDRVERTYSDITTSDLLSVSSIERRLRKLDLAEREEVEGNGLEEEGDSVVEFDPTLETLFPTDLVIERPRKVKISKRQVWQKWRNIVRKKNQQAINKYWRLVKQEETKKDSHKLVFDFSTCRLSDNEIDLLSKGETFYPTSHTVDIDRLKTDIYYFNRKLRLHEQFKDKKIGGVGGENSRNIVQLGRGSHRVNTTNTGRRSVYTETTNNSKDTTIKHRQLPSVYDPLTLNRNLNRYTSCIQEDCLIAIKSEVKLKDNIHKQHRVALKTLQDKINSKRIMITKADKGSGIVICDYELYIQKGTKYIEEEAGPYEKVEEAEVDLVARLVKQRNRIIENLKKENVIPLQIATFCTKQVEEKITGMKFYFKIHKDQNIATTPLRPLQSCISAPTHHLSLVLTDILQPLLNTKNIPSFIFDSNHLLFRLQNLGPIPSNCTLVSSDVSALYPSIPHQQGLEAMQLFLNNNTKYNIAQIEILIKALRLVISENFVMWNNTIYKQISGVAMGTPVAVAYANIFMAWVDNRVRRQTNYIHEHIRFIDDNLFIIPEEKINDLMQIANNILPSIKYTHDKLDKKSKKGLAFLDTQLFISEQRQIEARLYTKPTDTHAYLLPSSYHPPHIIKNIPAAVFKRLRRLSSRDEWFKEDAEEAKGWLSRRGYKTKEVNVALQQAEKLDRWDMIVRIEANRAVTQETSGDVYNIPFIVTYNKHAKTLKKVLKRRQDLLDSSYKHTKVRPRVTFRRQRNLDDVLIHRALRGPIRRIDQAENVFVKCGERQQYRGSCPYKEIHEKDLCRCCAHALVEPISSKVKLRKKVNCSSKNVVYVVGYRKCDKKYVGETQQTLRDRLAQHLNNISKLNQPLYLHFRLVHSPKYLYISVLETVRNTEQFFRKVREAWWINHLQTLEPGGFNVKLDCNQIYQESNI